MIRRLLTLIILTHELVVSSLAYGQIDIGRGYIPYDEAAWTFWGVNPDSCQKYTGLMKQEALTMYKNNSCALQLSLLYSSMYADEFSDAEKRIEKLKSGSICSDNDLGLVYMASGQLDIYHGNTSEGASELIRALSYFDASSDPMYRARIQVGLSEAAVQEGKYEMALQLLLEALNAYIRMNDGNNIVYCLNGLGRTMAEQGKTSFAMKMYVKALSLCRSGELEITSSISLNNIGMLYYIDGESATALQFFESAKNTDEEEGNVLLLPGRYNNIGNALLKLNRIKEAERYYTKALAMLDADDDPYAFMQISNNLADVKVKQMQYAEAEKLYLQSLHQAQALGARPLMFFNHEALTSLYRQSGQRDKELVHLRASYQLRDSLNRLEQLRSLDELEARYQNLEQKTLIDRLEQESQLQQTKIERDQNLKWIYILLLMMMSAAIFFFYHILKIRQKLNRALQKENNSLNDVNALKDRFLNLISHEFRTPISLIMAPAREIEKSDASTLEQKESARLIVQQSIRLLDQVNDLLDLAKAGNRMLELAISETSLTAFLGKLESAFQPVARENGIRLTFTCNVDNETIWIDQNKIVKVLGNLLSNALKYTPKGGLVELSVVKIASTDEPMKERHDEGWFRFSVSDNGPGIEESEQTLIFERFYRGKYEQSLQTPGSGIGLTVVKEFTHLHNGQIKLFSKPGYGAVFSVFLRAGRRWFNPLLLNNDPTGPDPLNVKKETPALDPDMVTDDESHHTQSILIVEDDHAMRKFLTGYFCKQYKVYQAADGQKGIDAALKYFPDLIVSDIQMPQKDGIDLCRTLKQNFDTSHIPVLLLTAKTDQCGLIEGLRAGADDYVRKPFDTEELELRINNIIARTKLLHERFSKSTGSNVSGLSGLDQRFMTQLLGCCEMHYANPGFDADLFTQDLNISLSTLHRKMKSICGTTPREFLKHFRLEKAKDQISNKTGSVSEVAYACGFENLSHFSKIFKEKFGHLPSETSL